MNNNYDQETVLKSGRITDSTEDLRQAKNGNPSHEAVAKKAYEIWLARKQQPVSELENWLDAEKFLSKGQVSSQRKI